METNPTFTQEDFEPLTTHPRARLSPKPVSKAQQVFASLYQNKGAFVSLILLTVLALFTFFGQWFWTVDPSQQDIMQISRGPSFSKKALVIANPTPFNPRFSDTEAPFTLDTAPDGLAPLGPATTEFISFSWLPVAGAEGYEIFRHEYPPHGRHDLGIPLASLKGNQISFRDNLRLEPITYYYSVVPIFAGVVSGEYNTLTVKAKQAITFKQAEALGLLSEDDFAQYIGKSIALPSHPLGTDYLGRDILARLIQGGKTSLFIGLVAPLLFIFIGLIYGGISGFIGGRIDEIMMRFADFIIALPFLLFMILFKIAFGIGPGESGVMPMLVAMILLGWPSTARLVRGQVLQLKEAPYIEAATLLGAPPLYVVIRHMLPNLVGLLLVSITFAIPSAIFTEAFLSFIGMGVVPPTPSWGSMCNDGIPSLLTHPHELFFPALIISLTVLAFNLLGDGLRDALDIKREALKG